MTALPPNTGVLIAARERERERFHFLKDRDDDGLMLATPLGRAISLTISCHAAGISLAESL